MGVRNQNSCFLTTKDFLLKQRESTAAIRNLRTRAGRRLLAAMCKFRFSVKSKISYKNKVVRIFNNREIASGYIYLLIEMIEKENYPIKNRGKDPKAGQSFQSKA